MIFSLRKFQVHTFESYEEQGTNQMRKFKLSKIHTFESYERAKATQRGSAVLMLGTILRSLSNSEHDNTPQWDNQQDEILIIKVVELGENLSNDAGG